MNEEEFVQLVEDVNETIIMMSIALKDVMRMDNVMKILLRTPIDESPVDEVNYGKFFQEALESYVDLRAKYPLLRLP